MTADELYRETEETLQKAGCDSPAFDALCLLEDLAGLPHGQSPRGSRREIPAQAEQRVRRAAAERASGRPLQYILGQWDFLRLTLAVGEGVLIPRPDTELLCEAAAQRLAGISPGGARLLDLCAGSGCVGLGVASLFPGAAVTAVEKSPEAFRYLEENCRRYPQYAVSPAAADVLTDAARFAGPYEAILSNPPYIAAEELPALAREVQREPRMALDGGDGLVFYRALAASWLDKLRAGGFCAVEVGCGQAAAVAALWEKAGLVRLEILRDLGGVERVVIGWRAE